MKNTFFSVLALAAAALTFSPVANAANLAPASSQQHSLQKSEEFLDAQTKAVENIQDARLEFLNAQTKAVENVQTARLEFLDSQTKAIDDNIQKVRLEQLNSQSKAVEDIQTTRLAFLESQTKAIENVHETRLEERARRNKGNDLK